MLTVSGSLDRVALLPFREVVRTYAQVAELVDALASGASNRKVVEVQVLSWAPLQSPTASHKVYFTLRNQLDMGF